jgi:Zn-finger nucleic acid-binding protein
VNRDEAATCPTCEGHRALDPYGENTTRLVCDGCKGVFIALPELERLVAEAKKHAPTDIVEATPLVLAATKKDEPLRRCPRCVTMMTKHDLHGIVVDRCEAHGLWFDHEELAQVLQKIDLASRPPASLAQKLAIGGLSAAMLADVAFVIAHIIWGI